MFYAVFWVTLSSDVVLVARGDRDRRCGRSDLTIADKEAVFVIVRYAVSRRLLRAGGLDHGYFRGECLTRRVLFKQPREAIPRDGRHQPGRALQVETRKGRLYG